MINQSAAAREPHPNHLKRTAFLVIPKGNERTQGETVTHSLPYEKRICPRSHNIAS